MTQPVTSGSSFGLSSSFAPDGSTALPAPGALIIAALKGRGDPFRVNLVGREYTFHPVKTWFTMRMAQAAKTAGDDPLAMLAALEEWLRHGLGQDGAAQVVARLDDPGDRLDLEDVMKLMEATLKVDDNPPT